VSVAAIGIMCKAPQSGRSKTRLAKAVGVVAASDLSACFLRDVAAAIEAVPDDLGYVLFGATRALLDAGHDCVLLVNGDSPTLPARFLVQAIETLREPGDRMVLGPASDGGYYLIGLKHPHRQLFTRIAWGTETVARSTCERAAEIGLATTLLPEWYDVDDIETLRWLQDELAGHLTRFRAGGFAPASRAFLKTAPQLSP
jgi:glycosyltransferase A (GT-A) superfamily protein (DUF2064 family)